MIPVNEPLVLEKDIEYVVDALKTGWISSEGKYINLFEEKFARYLGVKHAITVNNGTNALILALRALDLPKGSEVILPSNTIISCALGCIYNDLVPVFVDAEESTWCMDTSLIESKITKKTKAIMPVHIYGHSADMDVITSLAKKYDLYIVEDFAEAIGSEYKGIKCGGFGHIGCASFYANKAITTGEGGVCVTNDDEFAAKLRKLKNLSFIPSRRFVHHELGFNFRMTNIQAAIGLAQVERIEAQVNRKILIGKHYNNALFDVAKERLVQLPAQKEWALNSYWVYGVVLNEKLNISASEMSALLLEKGIQTRPFFYPLHKQPAFEKYEWYVKNVCLPVSEKIAEYGFYFPSGLTLRDEQIDFIAGTFKKILYENIKNT